MFYPNFLEKEDCIGISALSSGVGYKLDSFNESLHYLKSFGVHIIETSSVRNSCEPSTNAQQRIIELNELVDNEFIKAIWCAAGGDFQYETLPYINFEKIKENPKWYLGASDPTNLLFPITCKCDLVTIYGFNAGSFDQYGQNEYANQLIKFLEGKNEIIYSSKLHQHVDFYNDGKPILNTKTDYIGECNCQGRLLGGCFESISDMAGTPYDFVDDFLEKYKKDSIIWFFDIFSMNSCDVYRALLKMKYMGYFKYTKTILVGRVLFENVSDLLNYQEAFKRALPEVNCIFETDIGHTYPHFYMINGAIAQIHVEDGMGKIEFILK